MGRSGEGSRTARPRLSVPGGTPAGDGSDSIPPLPYPYRREVGSDPYFVPKWLEPQLERRWVPIVDIHLPFPVQTIADILDRIVADDIERDLVATSYPDSEDVIRVGYWQRVER